MPFLMVNLDDRADCRRAIEQLRSHLASSRKPIASELAAAPAADCCNVRENVANLPLPQKLRRIQQRRVWKHLVKIAETIEQPYSLPEIDAQLDLPKNKMRSLKAIMAKLENRFAVKFLRVAPDAGVDGAGNPRYEMVPAVRKNILKLV